jgi:hypothetical protein
LSNVDFPAFVYPTSETVGSSRRRHASLDPSPVDLELGLTGATRADAAGLLAELDTSTTQSREAVTQLRELDLDHALLAVRVLGEDVEDQCDAVDDVARELLLEIALLRRGELVVEHHHVDVEAVGEAPQLVRFARADIGRGVGSVTPLEHGFDGFGAGGVGQQPELGQARFGLVQRPGAGARADEKRALLGNAEVDFGGGEPAALAAFAVAHDVLTSVSKTCVTGPCSRIVSPSSTSCVPPRTCTNT